ncbi:MAG: MBL fold metallo-hydrolase [Blastocatellia bacterium]|nr:MBL fold metallo-hydrolase [Blastocatellia bacterium]
MQIHQIVVPTPFYVGPVNVYLIKQDPITIVDIGPNTEEAFQALKAGVENLGLRLDNIKRLIVSHAHADHYGMAARLQETSGAEIFLHSWEEGALGIKQDYTHHRKLLQRAGVPEEEIEKFETGYLKISPLLGDKFQYKLLEDEEEIIFEKESLRVLHTPGHTPGSICLMRESNRELMAADTVIKHITPNPMLNCDPIDRLRRFPSLSEYLCSVARIKELAPTLVHSGHGHSITDYGEHFHRLLKQTNDRQSKVISLLPKSGATAWEATSKVFPNVGREHKYLAVSEVQAHLDMAVADGKLKVEKQDLIERYYI